MNATFGRAAPALVAAALAGAYVAVSPPSPDLAAAVFRARIGPVLWNNLWYSGHPTLGYSVLMPVITRVLAPQTAAALASVATAAVFAPLARRHFGSAALPGATVFGAATAIDLYTGRLTLAVGALPALGALAALDRRRTVAAAALAALAGLCSPLAGLFAALGAAAHALARRRHASHALPGAVVAAAALAPVLAVNAAFPTAGVEPFSLSAFVPLPLICLAARAAAPRGARTLRAAIGVYGAALVAAYLVPSPVGSNMARLGTLLALPVAALLWWPARPRLLAAVAVPLLYIGWQAPIRDVATAAGDPSATAAYARPLLRFLAAQPGVFRTEVVFTRAHWEALEIGGRFPLARGWERQVDIADNPLFYDGRLTAATYERWLHAQAVRVVALPDVALDPSAVREAAIVRARPPYLRLVMRSLHWRVYAVAGATPLAAGPARVTAMAPAWIALRFASAGSTRLRVRYSPYWALVRGGGCVGRAGAFTRVSARRPGTVRVAIRFAIERVGASSPRCAGATRG